MGGGGRGLDVLGAVGGGDPLGGGGDARGGELECYKKRILLPVKSQYIHI